MVISAAGKADGATLIRALAGWSYALLELIHAGVGTRYSNAAEKMAGGSMKMTQIRPSPATVIASRMFRITGIHGARMYVRTGHGSLVAA